MIGRRIESRWSLPWLTLAIAALGLAGLGYGIALGRAPIALGSALPLAVAAMLLVSGLERPFAATFGEETIEVEGHGPPIPYADFRHVRASGIPHEPWAFRKASAPITVEHEGGVIEIPARLDASSHAVYRFLAGRLPSCGDRAVHPTLDEYLERQLSFFGPDRVWTYRAASRRAARGRFRRFRAVCFGIMMAGVVWMVAGFSGLADTNWAGAGIFGLGIGFCFFLVTLADDVGVRHGIKNWKNASLVIGPQGLAMVQGDIQGEVRWPELLDVRFRPKPVAFRFSQTSGLMGITLKVKGADILIADLYDRPLYLIYRRILDCSGRADLADLDELVDRS